MQTEDDRERILEQKARTYQALRAGASYDDDGKYHVQFVAEGRQPSEPGTSAWNSPELGPPGHRESNPWDEAVRIGWWCCCSYLAAHLGMQASVNFGSSVLMATVPSRMLAQGTWCQRICKLSKGGKRGRRRSVRHKKKRHGRRQLEMPRSR